MEDKALEFDVNIQDAQFNLFLRLSINSLHTSDYSGIEVRHGEGGAFRKENEAETDVVTQQESAVLSRFQDKQFTFRLPVGKSFLKQRILLMEGICICWLVSGWNSLP